MAQELLSYALDREGKTANQIALASPSQDVKDFITHLFGFTEEVSPAPQGFVIYKAFFKVNDKALFKANSYRSR